MGREDVREQLNKELRRVKSACKTLLKDTQGIPESRMRELESIALIYFDKTEIDKETLERGMNLQTKFPNEDYNPHGKRVVEYFMKEYGTDDGPLELEKLWRKHFLATMNPQFLPKRWSVDHKQEWKFTGLKIGKGRFMNTDKK